MIEKTINVNATQNIKVDINAIDVINKLRTNVLGGYHNWIDVKTSIDGNKQERFYIMYEEYKMDRIDREIEEDEYNYIMALITVQKYLEKHGSK